MRKTTTDAVQTQLGSAATGDNESGLVRVAVTGYDKTNGASIGGIKVAHYVKVNGVLTINVADDVATSKVGANGLGAGVTWDVAAVNNVIVVRVTGEAGKTIKWVGDSRRVIYNS